MTTNAHIHQFENGLTLVAEPMDWLESAAVTIMVPAGAAYDPPDRDGLANLTCEMVQRGAGERDSRQLIEDLERLGVDHHSNASVSHVSFGGAMMAEQLDAALPIFADILLRPHLPDNQFDEARAVCLQEVHSLEDELSQKAMLELRRQHYPQPWGRSPYGSIDGLRRISPQEVKVHYERTYRPNEAIIGVAGKIDFERVKNQVENLVAAWPARETESPTQWPRKGGVHHLPLDANQTHIAVAYDSVPYRHDDYYLSRCAVGVLSDGMSPRLFVEVREKRGLCYTVYASNHSLRDRGAVFCYSGTSTERAQETLDVMLAELIRVADGIEQAELDRLKARIKSSLIMQQESSPSRSSAIALDYYHLGRVQSVQEISAIMEAITCDDVNQYLRKHPPQDFTVVCLGEKPLEVNVGV